MTSRSQIVMVQWLPREFAGYHESLRFARFHIFLEGYGHVFEENKGKLQQTLMVTRLA